MKSPAFKVVVKPEHIAEAVPKNSNHCMIADALEESYKGNGKKKLKREASYVHVDLQTIRFTDIDKGVRYTYLTPPRAQAALLAFDGGQKPKPFSFILRDAVRIRETGWQGQRSKTASRKEKTYKPTGVPRKIVYQRQRQFGLCLYQPVE